MWLPRPTAPWQVQVAPAMDRIIGAETAAMRVTLARLLADVRGPDSGIPGASVPSWEVRRPVPAIADRGGAE
jgi:hypothetical protein